MASYHLHHRETSNSAALGKDFMYALCTLTYLILLSYPAQAIVQAESRTPTQAMIEKDTRRQVLSVIDQAADAEKQPPVLRTVLENMRTQSVAALSNEVRQHLATLPTADQNRLCQHHQNYLDELLQQYGHMAPVDRAREI